MPLTEEDKLRAAVVMYLRGRKVGKRFTGGELPVRFADIAKALKRPALKGGEVDRTLDRVMQKLRKEKKIRYSSRGGWEIWE
jgi:hypothetical protein